MDIKFYNTLTRKKETFKPIKKGYANIYSCGPTVYWYQHIGNMRSYIFADLLRRTLEYNKLKVKQVINVTDVGHLTSDSDSGEDKMEKAAAKEGKTAEEIANFYFKSFIEDLEKLNVKMPFKWPRASEHIKEQIELIKILEKKGFTYKTADGIYFDSSKFKDYGKLARLNIKGLKEGKRVDVRDKKHKADFALWKFSGVEGERQQEWKSPWGLGFPGWHIECSAMSMKYLGKHFDIHTGGEDHIPVHHTNEIAQSECATGKKFVNYWLHGAFLIYNGEKVSKSKGGLYTISELEEQGFSPETYRYFCLMTHYRKQLNFSLENLEAAKKGLERIRRKVEEIRKENHKGKDLTKDYEGKFLEAINDDLNLPLALQVFHKILEDFNFDPVKKIKLLEKMDNVFALGIEKMVEDFGNIPREIIALAKKRDEARKNRDWAQADILRNMIKERGFVLEDSPEGVKIRKEN